MRFGRGRSASKTCRSFRNGDRWDRMENRWRRGRAHVPGVDRDAPSAGVHGRLAGTLCCRLWRSNHAHQVVCSGRAGSPQDRLAGADACSGGDLFGRLQWKSTEKHVIDWSIPVPAISDRKRPLAANTMRRIKEGLRRYGSGPVVIAMEHGGRALSGSVPLPTVTTAKGGPSALPWSLSTTAPGRPVRSPSRCPRSPAPIALAC